MKKKTIYAITAAAVLGVLVFSAVRFWLFRDGARMYAGEVTRVENGILTVKDKRGQETVVLASAWVKKIGDKDGAISLGERILTIGVPTSDGAVQARVIRVFGPR